ncbi:hypothetical protein EA58_18845 [Photobacterium galatheae]|uniref:Cellulose biosynthesis protein BcsE n=2 Tax=Photobacterium galatheae TaxID=1654360 RepID=A0A066RRH2_9GAMM|nr:hypothetical protein EA58_18845 [Photobacterium galatheae]
MSNYQGTPPIEKKEKRSVYVNLFGHKSAATDYLILTNKHNQNMTFTCLNDKNSFYHGLSDEILPEFTESLKRKGNRIYFLTKNISERSLNVENIIQDIFRIRMPKQSTLTILIPDILLVNLSQQRLGNLLEQLKQDATARNITIAVWLYGSLATSLKPALMTYSHLLAGLATLTAVSPNKYQYHIAFWANRQGVRADETCLMNREAAGEFIVLPSSKAASTSRIKTDAAQSHIVLSKEALNDREQPTEPLKLMPSNQAALNESEYPGSTTLILGCDSPGMIRQLAIDCYRFRQKNGPQPNLIIRETRQCLRYSDEAFLLKAGVNLIVPHHLPFARLMSQAEAIQHQVLVRSLPEDIEALLSFDLRYENRGYLENQAFSQYCHQVMQRSTPSQLRFALVKLSLLPGMTADECLRLCHLRRNGDVVTACHDALYVLFSAIRQTDIHTALNNIFDFPVRDLFRNVRIIHSHHDTEQELKTIVEQAVCVSASAEHISMEAHQVSERSAARPEVVSLFAVSKPIQLQGES